MPEMANPFNYFNNIYCINLDVRIDRWEACKKEFLREQIEVERFSALTGDNRHLAFNKSQGAVISKALTDGSRNALILEDDVVFQNTMHLNYAMNELPEDWAILFLGANVIGLDGVPFQKPVRHSAHLFRITDAFQTHAVAYSRAAMEYIVKNFNPNEFPIYDEWLRVNMLKQFSCFIIAPQIAYQRAGRSDIWQCDADYTSLFHRGNELLV